MAAGVMNIKECVCCLVDVTGRNFSGLAFGNSERSCRTAVLALHFHFGDADGAEGLFIFHDVVLEREKQTLCVFRRHDDTVLDFCLSYARVYAYEVDEELRARVGEDREVGIGAVSHFGCEFDLQLVVVDVFVSFRIVVVFHDYCLLL